MAAAPTRAPSANKHTRPHSCAQGIADVTLCNYLKGINLQFRIPLIIQAVLEKETRSKNDPVETEGALIQPAGRLVQ